MGWVNEEGKGGYIFWRYFLYMCEYGSLKPVEGILRRGRGKRENTGEDEPNWGTLYTYMGMSQ
jgi:hypothetical protein